MNQIDAITCNLDFDCDGKSFGSIDLTFSDNLHAFGRIPIPVTVIRNGSGPTLLLTAGNHGDEYEGQIILRRLIQELETTKIAGRVIILPALNYPAVIDDARVSPLDQGNLNRSFPGVEGGSPTAAIADFVTREILPLVDAGIDLHSGGRQACYLPCTYLCTAADGDVHRGNLAMVDAFAAPYAYVVRGENANSGFDPVANRMGVPFISTELGGGSLNLDGIATGYAGVRNVMQHLGILSPGKNVEPVTRFLNGIDGSACLSAPFSGIFEPLFNLGDQVQAGDIAGYLYSLEESERQPATLIFDTPGVVLVRRSSARVRRGGHLFLVATEMTRDDVSRGA